MIINEIVLSETIDNLFSADTEKREHYADQVWEILQKSYAPIGGIKGSGFRSKEDMVANIPMWKLFRRGDDVKVVMMYKDKSGRKRVAMGTDGSHEAKKMLATMVRDEALSGRSFGEISGGSLAFTRKVLGDEFKNIVLPYERVIQVLKSDYEEGNIRQVDKYEYERNINGEWHKKVMVGNPGQSITQ